MEMIPEVAEIADRAKAHRVPMRQVMERTPLHYTTWMRWKHEGISPNLANLKAVSRALDDLIKERAAAQ